jgi:crossover junction endodeoxyribonuclease RusA
VTASIELVLPWPPTVNTYWRAHAGRLILSAAGRRYRVAVAEQVLVARAAKRITDPVRVTIEASRPDRRRRDLDNVLKAVLDGLAHAGVYRDDEQVHDLRIFWAQGAAGMCRVRIEEIKKQEVSVGDQPRASD